MVSTLYCVERSDASFKFTRLYDVPTTAIFDGPIIPTSLPKYLNAGGKWNLVVEHERWAHPISIMETSETIPLAAASIIRIEDEGRRLVPLKLILPNGAETDWISETNAKRMTISTSAGNILILIKKPDAGKSNGLVGAITL